MARTSAEERIQLEERLRTNLKKFFLSNVAVNRLLTRTPFSQLKELDEFLTWELQNRENARKQRLLKAASFPTMKSLADYRFDEVTMPSSMTMDQMTGLDFIREKHTLVLYGICGSGKTMLSIAPWSKGMYDGFQSEIHNAFSIGF